MSGNLGWLGHGAWVAAVRNCFRFKWHWDRVGLPSPRGRGEIRWRCISESGRRILFIGLCVYPGVFVA